MSVFREHKAARIKERRKENESRMCIHSGSLKSSVRRDLQQRVLDLCFVSQTHW